MTGRKPRKEEPIEVLEDGVQCPGKLPEAEATEVVEDHTPDPETPVEHEQAAVGEDTGYGSSGALRNFFPAAPARFAVHAAFYYAGRTADKVVSLYNRVFKVS